MTSVLEPLVQPGVKCIGGKHIKRRGPPAFTYQRANFGSSLKVYVQHELVYSAVVHQCVVFALMQQRPAVKAAENANEVDEAIPKVRGHSSAYALPISAKTIMQSTTVGQRDAKPVGEAALALFGTADPGSVTLELKDINTGTVLLAEDVYTEK